MVLQSHPAPMKPSSTPPSFSAYCLRAITATVDASWMYNIVLSLIPSDAPSEEQSEYSCRSWKHVPTTLDVLFGLQLPLRPPPSSLGAFLWRRRLWIETTFALSMLQPWEKFFVWIIVYTILALFTALSSYVLPDLYHNLTATIGPLLYPLRAVVDPA